MSKISKKKKKSKLNIKIQKWKKSTPKESRVKKKIIKIGAENDGKVKK